VGYREELITFGNGFGLFIYPCCRQTFNSILWLYKRTRHYI